MRLRVAWVSTRIKCGDIKRFVLNCQILRPLSGHGAPCPKLALAGSGRLQTVLGRCHRSEILDDGYVFS